MFFLISWKYFAILTSNVVEDQPAKYQHLDIAPLINKNEIFTNQYSLVHLHILT